MRRDIEHRYYGIKTDLRELFDSQLNAQRITTNSESKSAIVCNNAEGPPSLYWVNAEEYDYSLDGGALARLFQQIQAILDKWLLEGGPTHIWSGQFIATEFARGTQYAHASLSKQSQLYENSVTLSDLLFSPEYQRRIGIAYAQSYSAWTGISDKARADLADVISNAVARGINPRETAKIVSDRLDVSMSEGFNMAQTEQVGAFRKAIWDESDDAQERLGLRTALLWLSALKPTTRAWHASRHGNTYTRQEVEEFYARAGNRYHCYCSQTPVLIDMYGNPLNTMLVERLSKERVQWKADEAA